MERTVYVEQGGKDKWFHQKNKDVLLQPYVPYE